MTLKFDDINRLIYVARDGRVVIELPFHVHPMSNNTADLILYMNPHRQQ